MIELPPSFPRVTRRRPLPGGDTGVVELLDLRDGRRVVAKVSDAPARLEADGLAALRDAGAPVPAVLHVGDRLLVLEHVAGRPDWADLGRRVAALHRTVGSAFGWHEDNRLGPSPQPNPPTASWGEFLVTARIEAHARAASLPEDVRRRLRRVVTERVEELTSHRPLPSLVHGDLWSGNVVDGCFLVDPAVHHADREVDLAVARLFGGVPEAFHHGYAESWPLPAGADERVPLLQLPHLLMHVRAFGRAWLGAVDACLRQLGG